MPKHRLCEPRQRERNGCSRAVFLLAILTPGCTSQEATTVVSKGEAPAPRARRQQEHAQLRFDTVSMFGNGCMPGTWQVAPSNDPNTLRIFFNDFVVSAPSQGRRLQTKQCGLNMRVTSPPGYATAIEYVSIRGTRDGLNDARSNVVITPSVVGTDVASTPSGAESEVSESGPFSMQEKLSEDSLIFGRCGSENTFQLSVRLATNAESTSTEGRLTVEAIDALSFTLRKCS